MFKNESFWKAQNLMSVVGWIFIIFGLVNPFEGPVYYIWIICSVLWGIGHPLELFTSIPIGKKAGISTGTSIIKTILFGFTWWYPLKKGYIKE